MSQELLLQKIAIIIPKVFEGHRIRRGYLHSTVCNILGVPRSNKNIKLIKAVLSGYNKREVIIHGKTYYSN